MAYRRSKAGLHVKDALLDVVENQLRDGTPPETKETYDRLILDGTTDEEARRLIATVILYEMHAVTVSEQTFNLERFIAALRNLPEIPNSDKAGR